ncbi:MAG: glycosyltransferase, partial [Acidimicrobiia bacterium]
LASERNVFLVGARPFDEVPAILDSFDAAIIPYRVAPAIEASSPLKLQEYLAHGLPVVSIDIPEVRRFSPPVFLATGAAGFVTALDKALERGRVGPDKARTWEDAADEMVGYLTAALTSEISSDSAG